MMLKNYGRVKGEAEMEFDNGQKELTILLTEYQTLKDEEKTLLSFQFTVIGIWLTFLGVMIGVVFSQIEAIEDYVYSIDRTQQEAQKLFLNTEIMSQSRIVVILLITILIPGVCALFGLIWLDLATRFVKEAHYIYYIEHKISLNYPDMIGFDHFLYEETKNEKGLFKTNYVYYFLILGIMALCPVIVVIFTWAFRPLIGVKIILHHTSMTTVQLCFLIGTLCFIMIEVFTFLTVFLYVKRILSYPKKKELLEKSMSRKKLFELISVGAGKEQLIKTIKQDTSLLAEILVIQGDDYTVLQNCAIGEFQADFLLFSGKDILKVTFVKTYGADSYLLNKKIVDDIEYINKKLEKICSSEESYKQFEKRISEVLRQRGASQRNNEASAAIIYGKRKWINNYKRMQIKFIIIGGQKEFSGVKKQLVYNYAYNNIKLVYCSWKSCAEKLENMGC